jgi:uncharacterized membrane protein
MQASLVAHIVAGGVGILTGFIALYAVKGAQVHRKSGTVFVYAMIVMALLGGLIAVVRNRAPQGNVPVAALTLYLVITALITVQPPRVGSRRWDFVMMTLGSAITLTLVTLGVVAILNPKAVQGFPAAPFFVFGTIALMASYGDVRLIRSGGAQALRGAPRLARHLWRMCTALLIAAFSFFLGQAKVFPKPIRIYPLLAIPPLVVLAALWYWMWRVRIKRSLRGIAHVPEPRVAKRSAEAKITGYGVVG